MNDNLTYIKLYLQLTAILNIQETAVMSMLISLANHFGKDKFSATHQWIYERLHISKSTYFRIVSNLSDVGLIEYKGKNVGACKTVRTTEFTVLPKAKALVFGNSSLEKAEAKTGDVRKITNKAPKTKTIPSPKKTITISDAEKSKILTNIKTAPNENIRRYWEMEAEKNNINYKDIA